MPWLDQLIFGFQSLNVATGVAGRATHNDTTWLAVGAMRVDPSTFASEGRQLRFDALLAIEDSALAAAELRFWNLTHGYAIATLTSSIAQPDPEYQTANIAVGAAVANSVPNSASVISIQLRKSVTGDGSAKRALCDLAECRANYS